MEGRPLSLVLPAYNEEAGIRQAIVEADEALARLGVPYEILVVDDGSRDETAARVREEAAQRPTVRLLTHATNRGYGAALRTGFEAARYAAVAFTDADCQFHLDDLGLLLPRLAEAPVVVGYRIDRQDPWRRKFLSRGYNLIARTLLGTRVRDIDCALKVFDRDTLGRLLPESPGFFVNTEMLTQAAQQGLPIVEVGVRHRPRLRGQSTVSLREVPRTLGRMLPFWWSRVLFAGETPQASGFSWLGCALVLLVASLLFFARLRAPLLEPQEGRYAEIPRQMLAENSWLIPRLHGQDYLDKPPLFYWSIMASYQILGIRDVSARFVAGLIGVLTVLVTYLWGSRAFGGRAGFYGALALCVMPGFLYRGRMLTFDTLLMLWVAAGLAAGHLALVAGRGARGWWIASAVACGLGLLTKGPVALVLIAVPLFVLGWIDRRVARPGWIAWVGYGLVAVGLAAPWYAAVIVQRPEFATSFFWQHNVVRFLAPFDHAKPAWYYLPGLMLGLLPWWPVLFGLSGNLLDRSGEAAARRPAALGFALLASLWTVAFFSAAGCKRPTYLLPALPPLALAIGWFVQSGTPRDLWRTATRHAGLCLGVMLAASGVVAVLAGSLGVVPLPLGLLLAGTTAVGFALLALVWQRVTLAHATMGGVALLFVGIQVFLPAYNDLFSLRGRLRRMASVAEREGKPIVCYPQRYESLSFYLPAGQVQVFGPSQKREMLEHLRQHPGTMLLVKSGPVLQQLRAELPPGIEYRTAESRASIQIGRIVTRGLPLETMVAWDEE